VKKPRVRIDFCDFYHNFRKDDNFFYNLLKERFDVELSDQPDFLIYCCYGHEHRLHSCVKIFFSGESAPPDFRECDYSIASSLLDDPRHLQYANYFHYGQPSEIIKQNDDHEKILAAKTKFCSFLTSSHNPRKNQNRIGFFQKLSKYKLVDSGGKLFNNIGRNIAGGSRGKIEFLRPYKFNLAFENRSLAGYTTEKIFEPMIARCMPVYWGNSLITGEFNPKSFINYYDFPDDEAVIEKIIELDKDNSKYLEYMRQPYFYDDKPNKFFNRERMLDFFEKVFCTKISPVAQSGRKSWFFGRWKLVKRHHWHPIEPPTWTQS
jgi:hypothetical protein